jgi:hypothetical protein
MAVLGLPAPSAWAQAGPEDVLFSADVQQRFKYYVFADDFVEWANTTVEGTLLHYDAATDTATVHGAVGIATALDAASGVLDLDMSSGMTLEARTGVFHETTSEVSLSIYILGPAGTPYDITMETTGLLEASRVGGLPGSLQPVNGTTTAIFEDSTAAVPDGGVVSVPLDQLVVFSGTTTTEILVGGETYSLAHERVFTGRGVITQAVCILGCMTAPAQFHMDTWGHVTIRVYPGGGPTGAADPARGGHPLSLAAFPNPARGITAVTFSAPRGSPTRVDVVDVRGRRLAHLFEAIAAGEPQTVRWGAADMPAGVYFLRVESGATAKTKLTLVR